MLQNDKERGIPVVKKAIIKDANSDDDGEFDELFPSDLSDDDDEDRFLLKEERGEKKPKNGVENGSKKATKKVVAEEPQKKLKTKNTKAKVAAAESSSKDEVGEGEDIADEVVDFDMSEESESDADEEVTGDDDSM